ncbi:MAG: metallophosphoesterase [Chitinophagaceae bacterium]|nr:metallophosphoesterase [Chitinophagaceae bacterium]
MKPGTLFSAIMFLALFSLPFKGYSDSTFIKFGSSWKYLDNNTSPVNWQTTGFNDIAWNSGSGEAGYGDYDERNIISFGGNANSKFITTYFRKSISIPDINIYGTIRLNMYIDDGAVIYVNGTEVARTNMPVGVISAATLASGPAAEDGNNITTIDISTAAFVSGTNLIAVEVHQESITSSDLSFDFELIAKPAGTTVFNYGATWKYLDNGTNQGTAWRGTGFNDASWSSGPSELGYGDAPATTVSYGPDANNKYVTTYFRKTVTITNPSSYTIFNASIRRDDGCVVYVNGTQVYISNLSGTVAYNTFASTASDDGATPQSFTIPTSAFVNGTNVIAVEMHQSSLTSTDLTFDMVLSATAAGAEPEIIRGPMLQMVSETAVTIRWTTATASNSQVWIGTTESNITSNTTNASSVTDHEIRITGLTADTKYYYGIGTSTSLIKGSYRNYFITAPAASTTRKIRIGVFGDAGTGNSTQKSTRNSYLNLKQGTNNSELALLLGDNAYDNGLDAEHQTNMFDIYDNNVFDNHVVFPVPGNHEYANNASRANDHNIPYFDVFTVPTAAQSGGLASGTEHYYSFDYGNIHFIMLDSYGYDGGKLLYDSTGAQAVWLKNDLAASTRKWNIVCLHHPPYTNGTHLSNSEADLIAIRQQITPILERFGVDVVLSGHSHVYERSFLIQGHTGNSASFNISAPPVGNLKSSSSAKYDGSANSCPYFTIGGQSNKGTVYVVAGSAGQIGGGTNALLPAFYYRNFSGTTGGEVGVLYMEVEDNRLDAKFVGASGTVRDQFTIMKDVNRNTSVNMIVNTTTNLTSSWVGGYNWFTTPIAPLTVEGTSKSFSFTPSAVGTYTWYVRDSVGASATCLTDTFTVQVAASLAISLLKFDVYQKNETALLQWSSAYEVDNDYYIIERSTNGIDYNIQISMKGAGNSQSVTNYEYIDSKPVEGINYYRLIQKDKSGKTSIVGIRKVNFRSYRGFNVVVHSNPVLNNDVSVTIQSVRKQSLIIRVFDISGAEVYQSITKASSGDNKIHFPLSSGNYILSIENENGSKVAEKLIVR